MNTMQCDQLFAINSTETHIRQLTVSVCHDARLIRGLINQWHSFRPAPQGWRVAFILSDGLIIYGVSTFGRPVARNEDQETTLEHTRMALSNAAPRNSATHFMAMCREWIRRNMPEIHRLISYVPSERCSGVTYRGDNWRIVYENQVEHSTWTNRDGRMDSGNKFRTKFERVP